jgi:hypothetical protein
MNTYLLSLALLVAADGPAQSVNSWVKESPTDKQPAPMFSWEGSGAYDPGSKKWIHFGGHDGVPQGFHLFTYDLDTHAWQQRFPQTSPPGVCCIDGANAFDVANGRFVNFPGGSLGHGYQWSREVKLQRSAVWLYDAQSNTWTNMRPAPYHRPLTSDENIGGLNAGAAYDDANEVTYSFGGQATSGGTSALHAYDAYANKLTRIAAPRAPSPRDGMGICVDTKNDCIVVFGSQYSSDEKTHLFRLKTGSWETHDLEPRPNAKKGKTYSTIPRLAYDSRNEVCLCLIRDDAEGKHETWALNVAKLKWTKMSPATEPDASMSRSRNMSYLADRNVVLLDSNPASLKGKGAEIWTYRYRDAPTDARPAAPKSLEAVTDTDRVALSWPAVSGAKAYHVYRAEAAAPWQLDFALVAKTSDLAYVDTKPTPGAFYVVRAVVDGVESGASPRARSEPRVLLKPVVSVLAADKVEVTWNKHPASDIAGYNVYRGTVKVRTTLKGEAKAWRDNDPEYADPTPVEVTDIVDIRKLNDKLVTGTSFADAVELAKPGPESKDYKFAVHAYIVRAVNKLGVESGPSPYALTIPSPPTNVLVREQRNVAELKWDASPEKGVRGYHVYKLQGTWNIVRLTPEPIQATTFTHTSGETRFWVVAVDALGQEGEPSSPAWHQHSYKGFFPGDWHQ